jgi:hypothetical protein
MAADDFLALLPPQPYEMSEAQWSKIVTASAMPDQARPLVGRAISLYRLASPVPSPHETRRLLLNTAKLMSELYEQLRLIENNRLALLVLARSTEDELSPPEANKRVKRKLSLANKQLLISSDWIKTSASRVASAKPGAHGKSLTMSLFILVLEKIWEQFKGAPISRSGKGKSNSRLFIEAVFSVADPTVGKSSIDESMKRVIRGRGGITEKIRG